MHHGLIEFDIVLIPGILQHRVSCHDALDHRVKFTFAALGAVGDGFTCVNALEMLTLESLHDAIAAARLTAV